MFLPPPLTDQFHKIDRLIKKKWTAAGEEIWGPFLKKWRFFEIFTVLIGFQCLHNDK